MAINSQNNRNRTQPDGQPDKPVPLRSHRNRTTPLRGCPVALLRSPGNCLHPDDVILSGCESYIKTPVPEFRCTDCGHPEYRDTKIHDGQSIRRDCARCGRTAGFPLWFGKPRPDWPDNAKRLFPGRGDDVIAPIRTNRLFDPDQKTPSNLPQ